MGAAPFVVLDNFIVLRRSQWCSGEIYLPLSQEIKEVGEEETNVLLKSFFNDSSEIKFTLQHNLECSEQ